MRDLSRSLETHNNDIITVKKRDVDRRIDQCVTLHAPTLPTRWWLQVHGGWTWRKADVTMNTVYIYQCGATWDSSQINTFLLLTTPFPHSILLFLLFLLLLFSPSSLAPLLTLFPDWTHRFLCFYFSNFNRHSLPSDMLRRYAASTRALLSRPIMSNWSLAYIETQIFGLSRVSRAR